MSTAVLLPFEEFLQTKYHHLNSGFSGDGGDKVLPCHLLPHKIMSESDFLKIILEKHSFTKCSPSVVSGITGVAVDDLLHGILAAVAEYPEKTWNGKYLRYVIYERGLKLMVEGPDKVRYYHWAHCPFYSLPFFKAALAVPQAEKRNNVFYRRFLTLLHPGVAAIPYANIKRPYNTNLQTIDVVARHLVPGLISGFSRKILWKTGIMRNPTAVDISVKRSFIDELAGRTTECRAFLKHFGESAVSDTRNIDLIITFLAVIDCIHGGRERT